MTDVKMTSVDSGVETGNDSNDSAQPESQQLRRYVKAANSVIQSTSSESQLLRKIDYEPLKIEAEIRSTAISSTPIISEPTEEILEYSRGFEWHNQWRIEWPRDFFLSPECLIFDTTPSNLNKPTTLSTEPWNRGVINDFQSVLQQFDKLQKQCRVRKYSSIIARRSREPSRRRNSSPFYAFPCDRRMRLGAATNNIELVRRMLEKGLSPNNCDEQGRSPLHLASSRGYADIVKLLLDYGADPNVRDCIGNTPLHLAAVTSKGSVVKLLLNAGTDVSSSDRHGYNPLQLAQTKLRMLQNFKGSDMNKIKEEVHKIVGMILTYLQKKKDAACDQIDTLTSFCSRISLSNTSDQVQDDLKDLLASIDSLSLK